MVFLRLDQWWYEFWHPLWTATHWRCRFCTKHWPNNDCWIQFYIAGSKNIFGNYCQKYCNPFQIQYCQRCRNAFSQVIAITILVLVLLTTLCDVPSAYTIAVYYYYSVRKLILILLSNMEDRRLSQPTQCCKARTQSYISQWLSRERTARNQISRTAVRHVDIIRHVYRPPWRVCNIYT